MKILDWERLDAADRAAALVRPAQRSKAGLRDAVRSIVEDVRDGGWDALAEIAIRIDETPPQRLAVGPAAEAARRELADKDQAAIALAARNIAAFHDACRPRDVTVETMPGLNVAKVWRPIERIGLYIPGGATPLFSTLLMLALPARAAGVPELVVVAPPATGGLDPAIALAAEYCGIDAIWTVGGAQAIAALAFGAGDIPRVDKICGPGNAWVAAAKALVASMAGGPAIDLPAGPSELLVIADAGADPATIAADLLSQAEHDAAAQVLLATDSADVAARVAAELERQLPLLPRVETARSALRNGRILLTRDLDEAVTIANLYAPEHLALAVADPAPLLERVRNAGAVFVGRHAAETFGDYLAGSSHVLPTDGAARAWSGISVHSFLKAITVQSIDAAAAAAIAAPAAALARLEGLEAHARAAEARAEQVAA
ncbi:histidinol dehydrogenase [Allosphingosinicella indica]|uniref:Histidinol dehydrogenase n=1 Tax=Allosphingosinicella indica TaxID=941907 RepID=A0A1X7FYF1_9SPHN|nr:histidinol dehydrogenase [Allosphingosinicella indica]SMF61083.1 histidinol dehydrogenase [Allosphingosinicella indica]